MSVSGLRDVALDRVRERVHARERREALRHGRHHLGVDERDDGDVVRVHAHELALLLDVRDHVVDRDFGGGAGRRGHGEDRLRRVLRGGHALERAHVRELRVRDDDAHGLRRVHGGAAADRDDAVGLRGLERLHAVLHVRDRGVRLDLGVDRILHLRLVQEVRHLLRDAELDEVGIGEDDRLLEPAVREFVDDFLHGACAVVGGFIQDDAVHFSVVSVSGEKIAAYYTTNARHPLLLLRGGDVKGEVAGGKGLAVDDGGLLAGVVENREEFRAALVEEVKKQFQKQIEESNKKNKELLTQIEKMTKQQQEQTKANKENIDKLNEQNKKNLEAQQKKNDEALAKIQAQNKQQIEQTQKFC